MFGHDDKIKDEDKKDEATTTTAATDSQVVNPDATDNAQADAGVDEWQHPGPPPSDDEDGASDTPTDSFTAGDQPTDEKKPEEPDFASDPIHAVKASSNNTQDELIDIKQEALGKLTPLVGHLDQTPDEKFRTLMMMIQASDDQSLLRQAYDTALEIEDEKARAQALLDIVNEINYFTTQHKA